MHTKHIHKQNLARPNIGGETDVLFAKKNGVKIPSGTSHENVSNLLTCHSTSNVQYGLDVGFFWIRTKR
jgi:hypothetical protein